MRPAHIGACTVALLLAACGGSPEPDPYGLCPTGQECGPPGARHYLVQGPSAPRAAWSLLPLTSDELRAQLVADGLLTRADEIIYIGK